jgi:hypothetical protein
MLVREERLSVLVGKDVFVLMSALLSLDNFDGNIAKRTDANASFGVAKRYDAARQVTFFPA